MSIVIKAGAGLFAGVIAGVLGLAFMPQDAPNAVKPRLAVEKPQFVVAKESRLPDVQTASAVAVTPEAQPTPTAKAKPTPQAKPAAQAQPAPDAMPIVEAKAVAPPQPPSPAKTVYAPPDPPQTTVETPAPKPATAASANDAAARWSVPGLIALSKGDLSTARLFLSRAAEAGDARAWVALADTYDPAMLAKLGVVGAPGDAQLARDYLGKAVAAGVVGAKDRMAALDQHAGAVR